MSQSDLIWHIILGAQVSNELAEIYRKRDDWNNRIIGLMFLSTQIMAVFVHIIPIILPLLYISFGFPSSDNWFTPLDVQKG